MFDRDQVESLEQVEQLLDEWEAWCEHNPQPGIDTFLDQVGSCFPCQVIGEFQQKVAQLAKLDQRLGAIADLSGSPARSLAEDAAAGLSPKDLQPGLEPIPGYRLTSRLGAG